MIICQNVTKNGKFGGRRDKYAVEEMIDNPITYKVFSNFIGIIEILQENPLGKLTFCH